MNDRTDIAICMVAGVGCVVAGDGDVLHWQLDTKAKSIFGLAWREHEKAEAKKRQGTRTDLTSAKCFAEVERASDKVGERVGVSGRSIDMAKVIGERTPERTRSHIEAQAALALSVDAAIERGEVTAFGDSYQVGNSQISNAEVDRWRKLAAIPDFDTFGQNTGDR